MKKYKFLLKPFFFIINLVFATWLVLKIEKVNPSDLGKYESLFKREEKSAPTIDYNKQFLKTLFTGFRSGSIDSITFESKLDEFILNFKKSESK